MLRNKKHFLERIKKKKLTLVLLSILCFGLTILRSANLPKGDSTKLYSIQSQIDSSHGENKHADIALHLLKKSKLERKIFRDTTDSFISIEQAIESAGKSGNTNLEFYCLYSLRRAQFASNIAYQNFTQLDTTLQNMLSNSDITDTLSFYAHQLWGNIYEKHNYHILALNEYIISQNIAYNLVDKSKITENLIRLLQVYNILKDDYLFKETQALIESYMPEHNTELKMSYYLTLRSFEYRYSQSKSESFLKQALLLSPNSEQFDFKIHKELAIYYIQNLKIDSALSEIKYLESNYLIEKPLNHLYVQIHIEELYARFFYNTNNFSVAQTKYSSALSLCDEMNSPLLKRRLLLLTLKITKDLDDYKMAFEALRSLKLLEDSTMNRSQIVEYQKLKNELYNEKIAKKIDQLEYSRKISEFNLRTQTKNIIWLVSATIALTALILVIFFGYTQKRRRSKELLALNNLKDFIFGVISHDLRIPLYNFNTLLGMAENKYLKEEEYSGYLRTIQTELKGITGVTESLLCWAKSNQGLLKVNLTVNSLMDILTEVKDIFKTELVERNIHIISNFVYDFEIKTDKDLFTFILRNIIQNAVKFSDDRSQIEINAVKENNRVIIEVVDYGAGMSEEQLTNINQQISSPAIDITGFKSTGLGLIIAKDFAKRLNIKNEIKSVVGKGTSVKLSFECSYEVDN